MTLAFRLPVAPRAAARRLALAAHALGAAGGVLGVAFLWRTGGAGTALAAAALLSAGFAASWRRSTRDGPRGELVVAADGAARWCGADDAAGRPFVALRWQAIGGIVCVEGECEGRAFALLSSAPPAGTPELDRLMAWLRWLDRGGPAAP